MALPLAYFKLSKEKKALYKMGWCDEYGNPTDKGTEIVDMLNFDKQVAELYKLALDMNKELKDESCKES